MDNPAMQVLSYGHEDASYSAGSLPCFFLPSLPMEVYDPQKHGAYTQPYKDFTMEMQSGTSATKLRQLPLFFAARFFKDKSLIPRAEDCYALWDRYAMLDNIRAHSQMVADFALVLAQLAAIKGLPAMPEASLAAGLLHDLGKTHSIAHGGDHAQIGAAWVMRETRNAAIARAVLTHVYWPWELLLDECTRSPELLLVLLTLYADKRVKHDCYVTVDERYVDLFERYGKNELATMRVGLAKDQAKAVEVVISNLLEVDLNEHTVDSGRLVKRT